MNILRYHPRAAIGDGGITNSVWESSRALAALGARVVVAFDQGEVPACPPNVEAIRVAHRGRIWRVPEGLESALTQTDVLVLHSAWTPHNVYAGGMARRLGVPYILEPRGAYNPQILKRKRHLKRVFWKCWEHSLVMGAAAVHVFFEEEAVDIRRLGYEGPIIVAPNGVRVPDGLRWKGALDSYLMWLGRFDPEHKGIDLLLRAMASLSPEERRPIRLHGPDWKGGKHQMRNLVKRLDLASYVHIGAPVYGDEKFELMAGAGAFTYPSRWEAFGNAPAEAGALGVPLLLTAYPLARYLGEKGAAIQVSTDVDGLRQGLIDVRSPQSKAVGARAAEVLSDFKWRSVASRWLDQLESAIT